MNINEFLIELLYNLFCMQTKEKYGGNITEGNGFQAGGTIIVNPGMYCLILNFSKMSIILSMTSHISFKMSIRPTDLASTPL